MTSRTHRTALESSQVTRLRAEITELVLRTCLAFINEPCNRVILGSKEYLRLQALLTSPHPDPHLQLNLFSQAFRAQIPAGYSLIANFDSARHWSLVDAISFLEDSRPGAWPYTTEDDCLRYLSWSRQEAESLTLTVH